MASPLAYELLRIGLTQGEAKVYIALSELGSSTVGPIVKKAGIASSNVYDILNRLLEKGIVSYILQHKIKYFQAARPQTLFDFLKKKEDDIQEQKGELAKVIKDIEQLQQLTTPQKAEIFFGARGLKAAYEKLLVKKNTGSENVFFYIHKKEYAQKADLFYFSILSMYEKITKRGVVNEFARTSPWFQHVKKIKFRYAHFPIPSNIDICNDAVLLVSWGKEITAVLIQSADIAHNLRRYFNEVWKVAYL